MTDSPPPRSGYRAAAAASGSAVASALVVRLLYAEHFSSGGARVFNGGIFLWLAAIACILAAFTIIPPLALRLSDRGRAALDRMSWFVGGAAVLAVVGAIAIVATSP